MRDKRFAGNISFALNGTFLYFQIIFFSPKKVPLACPKIHLKKLLWVLHISIATALSLWGPL